jgi:uncharacterized protein (DUF952 family)
VLEARIYHIAESAAWERARVAGVYVESTRNASLDEVGFVHCSFRHQVESVANYVYPDRTEGLVLLEIDTDQVTSPIRVESVDGGPEGFPHLYGPLPIAGVRAVHQLARLADRWALPPGR